MYKKSKSGIFRPYKGIYRNERGEVIYTEEFDEDIARRKKFYEQIDRRIEQAKLAKEQEELARKKEIVAQLKDAQLEIEMNILHSLISMDIVLFAYNYYRSVLCMHASEELNLETLEFYHSLPYDVSDWDLPSKIDIMDKYLPMEYNHNILLGCYTVRDLLGCARAKLLGIRDCSEDFFTNHCKYVTADYEL
jgi:hypothetical protein